MKKKKLFYLLSLLFVLSYGTAWGMGKKNEEEKKQAQDDAWKKSCDYLEFEFENLLNMRLVNRQFDRFVNQYCREPGWQPLLIKLPKKLVEISNIDDFETKLQSLENLKTKLQSLENLKTKLQSLKNLFGPNRQICLVCSFTDITREQLNVIADLFQNNLQQLILKYCGRITNKDLQYVTNLKKLQQLEHIYCPEIITDVDLKYLSELKKLQKLDPLSSGLITDEGLKYLSELKNLRKLRIGLCDQITDKGLEHLANHPNLRVLDIWACYQITNKGLEHLATLPNLRSLDIGLCPKITDEGLEHFANHPNLRDLKLDFRKQITDEAIEKLQKSNPELKIFQLLEFETCCSRSKIPQLFQKFQGCCEVS